MTLSTEQAVEFGVALSSTVVGASHIVCPADWADVFKRLHGMGTAGAFVNGGLCLLPATVILACHQSVGFPKLVVTGFGVLLAIKATICFVLPNLALHSMKRGADNPSGFVKAGVIALLLAGWSAYCATR